MGCFARNGNSRLRTRAVTEIQVTNDPREVSILSRAGNGREDSDGLVLEIRRQQVSKAMTRLLMLACTRPSY